MLLASFLCLCAFILPFGIATSVLSAELGASLASTSTMAVQPWRRVPGKALLFLLNLFSAVALIFEGYNQGVFGTVSGTPGFIAMANIGYDDIVTDATKQGGLAAAYYFGAMIGCLVGGRVLPVCSYSMHSSR